MTMHGPPRASPLEVKVDDLVRMVKSLGTQLAAVHTDWGKLLVGFSRHEGQLQEHDRRLLQLERERVVESDPPPGFDEHITETGHHVKMTIAEITAWEGRIRQQTRDQIRSELARRQEKDDASMWRWTRSSAGKILTHVLAVVVTAGLAILWSLVHK